jgi:hypothetical protein
MGAVESAKAAVLGLFMLAFKLEAATGETQPNITRLRTTEPR